MEKLPVEIVNLLSVVAILCIPFLKTRGRGILSLGVITLSVLINSALAFFVFKNGPIEYSYPGSWITGNIPVRIDYLSAWFILVISFTFLTGAWYGARYMNQYKGQPDSLALHAAAFILLYTSLIDICLVQNSLVFLVVWEIMALCSFVVVIFEHQRKATIKAGINFLIQSHIGILLLTVAFIWLKVKTGTFDLNTIATFTASQPPITGLALFMLFFAAFAIKAGFVPFHTWLPLAHPAAPAHISGIMSGVIIKIGIYGLLRVLMLIKTDMVSVGYFILFISVITGLYGVMLAIVQHNLKKLLAYHSIENIGIIGIGIGLGALGLGYHNQLLVLAGLGGALLHVLNHSLFKSLLFFSAGNIYQAKHTMNIESLGGLVKQLPRTSFLFLIGALAICGLPPFNGFVSEFFLYNGLFHGLVSGNFKSILFILFTILSLVIIGGLAFICFTKAFGIVFLGTEREVSTCANYTDEPQRIWPMYMIGLMMMVIGVLPFIFNSFLVNIVSQFLPGLEPVNKVQFAETLGMITKIGWYSLFFLVLILLIFSLRLMITRRHAVAHEQTWGCAYPVQTARMQYTASSFVRAYRKLAEPVLSIEKKKAEAKGLYPQMIMQKTHAHDKIETWLIDKPLLLVRRTLNSFVFLQNGNIQAYILYGFVFVSMALLLPALIEKLVIIIKFLNQI